MAILSSNKVQAKMDFQFCLDICLPSLSSQTVISLFWCSVGTKFAKDMDPYVAQRKHFIVHTIAVVLV